jgi:hypothetical protein
MMKYLFVIVIVIVIFLFYMSSMEMFGESISQSYQTYVEPVDNNIYTSGATQRAIGQLFSATDQ